MDDVRLKAILDKYNPETVLLKRETHSNRIAITANKFNAASTDLIGILQGVSAYIPREKLEEFGRCEIALGNSLIEMGECVENFTADESELMLAAASFIADLRLYYQEQIRLQEAENNK